MPNNIQINIDRMRTLVEKLSVKAHKLRFEINQGKASAEEVTLIEAQLKLLHLVQDLENLNLGIDIAQDEIKKGTLDKDILEGRLKPQLERDLFAIDKKLKSALRAEKEGEKVYEEIK